jgi:hypothetical protein
MSIISALKTYIATYSGLEAGAPLLVDVLGKEPTQYAIVPIPGARVAEWYINGGSKREYPFAIQSMEANSDDAIRAAINEFYESLADWFESQTLAGTLPTLATGKTSTDIEALGWGFLSEFGESGSGIYQIQAKLTYEQLAT